MDSVFRDMIWDSSG